MPTAALNRWLIGMLEQHPPPAPQGKRIKLRYMTQAKTRPPAFVVMCSHPDKLPDSYTRYLVNGLRQDFDMPGTPIRLAHARAGGQEPLQGQTREKRRRLGQTPQEQPPQLSPIGQMPKLKYRGRVRTGRGLFPSDWRNLTFATLLCYALSQVISDGAKRSWPEGWI